LYDVDKPRSIVKKVRINLKKSTNCWTFVLFDSAESAFYLKDENLKESDIDYYRVITVMPEDVIEVEWLGSEFVFGDEYGSEPNKQFKLQHEKFDKVRLCKLTPIKTKSRKTGYVELHSGWVQGGVFNWRSCGTRDDIKITQIKGKVVSKLDFDKLFVNHKLSEEEQEFEDSFKAEDFVN